MKHTIILLVVVVVVVVLLLLIIGGGCGIAQHTGRVNTYNAAGNRTASYEVILDRSMLMETTAPDGTIVRADSRGGPIGELLGELFKGIFELITLGLIVNN